MNVQQFWAIKTNSLLPQVGNMQQAWLQAGKIYPDAVILIRATGATQHGVAQFCNARIKAEAANIDGGLRRGGQPDFATKKKADFVKIHYPQFANTADSAAATVANSADGIPVPAPQLKALFRLPMDATASEWAAAWTANNGKAFPINFGRVFDGICEAAQNSKGLSYEDALRATKARFPDLWAMCVEMAKQPV